MSRVDKSKNEITNRDTLENGHGDWMNKVKGEMDDGKIKLASVN